MARVRGEGHSSIWSLTPSHRTATEAEAGKEPHALGNHGVLFLRPISASSLGVRHLNPSPDKGCFSREVWLVGSWLGHTSLVTEGIHSRDWCLSIQPSLSSHGVLSPGPLNTQIQDAGVPSIQWCSPSQSTLTIFESLAIHNTAEMLN